MQLIMTIREVFERAGPAAALMLGTVLALVGATLLGYG